MPKLARQCPRHAAADERLPHRMLTERLELRPAVEADRTQMVPMWQDASFMEFSGGVMSAVEAEARFDRLVSFAAEVPFAKQPVIERSTGRIIGYSGVDTADFEGQTWLEYGYRLIPEARAKGYATEAAQGLLALAEQTVTEPTTILAIIDPRNEPSQNVARKLGFAWWKIGFINGYWDSLWRLRLG